MNTSPRGALGSPGTQSAGSALGRQPGGARSVIEARAKADNTQASKPSPGVRRAPSGAAFSLALAFVFIRFSYLHEFLTFIVGVNLYLLYIIGIPLLLVVLRPQTITRVWSASSAKWWLLFILWFAICVPSSHWPSDSMDMLSAFAKGPFLFLIAVVSLHSGYLDMRRLFRVMLWAGLVYVCISLTFQTQDFERSGLEFGILGNANDLAAHWVFMLPFFLYFAMAPGTTWSRRILILPLMALAVFFILSTGSRGGFLGLLAESAFLIAMTRWKQRIVITIAGAALIIGAMAVVPHSVLDRLMTLVSDQTTSQYAGAAAASSESRQYLLEESLKSTAKNPLLGVGPGQFGNSLGMTGGSWQNTHNSYTQISSEMGLPGIFFFGMAFLGAIKLLRRARKIDIKGREHVAWAATCLLACLVGFATSATFLSLAYSQYFIALSAFATVINSAAQDQPYA